MYFNSDLFMCTRNFSKQTCKTGIWVQNHFLNLFSSAVNSQRLLCSRKAGVKCSYTKCIYLDLSPDYWPVWGRMMTPSPISWTLTRRLDKTSSSSLISSPIHQVHTRVTDPFHSNRRIQNIKRWIVNNAFINRIY